MAEVVQITVPANAFIYDVMDSGTCAVYLTSAENIPFVSASTLPLTFLAYFDLNLDSSGDQISVRPNSAKEGGALEVLQVPLKPRPGYDCDETGLCCKRNECCDNFGWGECTSAEEEEDSATITTAALTSMAAVSMMFV